MKKQKFEVKRVSEADYFSACREYYGWCRACQDFTTDSVEPDAMHYQCSVCDQPQVFGAENALLCGVLEIE